MQIPTTKELYNRFQSEFESEFNISGSIFKKSAFKVISAVNAGVLKLLYLSAAFVLKNIFVDTADPESQGGTLERFGRVYLGRDPRPATQGKYTIDITGDASATIFKGQQFKADDNSASPGALFVVETTVSFSNTGQVQVRALEAGTGSRLDAGDTITATSPMPTVDQTATVTIEDVTPTDGEDLEDYREAALLRARLEPQGGAATDYRLWASDVPAVQNSFPYAKDNAVNTAIVYVEVTRSSSIDDRGTPSAGLLQQVNEVINFDPDTTKPLHQRGRRPITVRLEVEPITAKNVDIELINSQNFDAEAQNNVIRAIDEHILSIRPYVPGADLPGTRNDKLSIGGLNAVIFGAITDGNITYENITVTIDGNPMTTAETFENGDIPHMNNVFFL